MDRDKCKWVFISEGNCEATLPTKKLIESVCKVKIKRLYIVEKSFTRLGFNVYYK